MDNNANASSATPLRPARRGDGFSLIELLIVITLLGILGAITVFAVIGMTDKSEQTACGADGRVLSQSAEVYFAENSVDSLPATGISDDRYELTLINAGYLKQVSSYYDLAADGTVTTNGDPCT